MDPLDTKTGRMGRVGGGIFDDHALWMPLTYNYLTPPGRMGREILSLSVGGLWTTVHQYGGNLAPHPPQDILYI
jgi:hypothetical protein